MYILTIISAVMLFGFMVIGIMKYGLLDCYSAYGPKWAEWYPDINVWSVVTFLSAFLMVPVMLEVSFLSAWQFLGFLAPVSLFWVAASPNYQTDKFANIMHQCGAWGALTAAIAYVCIVPHLWWVAVAFGVTAAVLALIFKNTWMFWGEVAVYSTIYAALLIMI